jgi:uncharacterized Fe-S cluster protein YjdI
MAEVEERKKPTVAREYRTGEIVVTWEPSFCMHSARCLMGRTGKTASGRTEPSEAD